MVGGLFLLLIGIFLGVNIARVGERARHGGHESPPADERPRIGPEPQVDWGAINLDLSAPRSSDAAKDRTSF